MLVLFKKPLRLTESPIAMSGAASQAATFACSLLLFSPGHTYRHGIEYLGKQDCDLSP